MYLNGVILAAFTAGGGLNDPPGWDWVAGSIVAATALLIGASFWATNKWWPALRKPFVHRRLWRTLLAILPSLAFTLILPRCFDRSIASDPAHHPVATGFAGVFTLIFAWAQFVAFRLNDTVVEELKIQRELVASVQDHASFILGVARAFLNVVSIKATRVSDRLKQFEQKGTASPDELLDALSPLEQRASLVMAVYELLRPRVDADYILRVTYLEAEGNYLLPRIIFDGQIRKDSHAHSAIAHCKDAYRTDGQQPRSVAVWVAKNGARKIISDAKAAEQDLASPFSKVDSPDVESMVGIPLSRPGDLAPIDHVLTIETSKSGYFSEAPEKLKELDLLVDNAKERLLYELDVARFRRILERGAKRNGHHGRKKAAKAGPAQSST